MFVNITNTLGDEGRESYMTPPGKIQWAAA